MLLSGKSLGRTSERRFDTSLAVFEKKCSLVWKLARESGSEKSGCPFPRRSSAAFFQTATLSSRVRLAGFFLKMNEGWLKLHRSLQDHPRSSEYPWMMVWIHLLMLATHKPHRTVFGKKIIELKPGQLITSRLSLAQKTGLHESRVERVLKTMIFEQQIEQESSYISRLITIRNWNQYQSTEQASEQQSNSSRTALEQQSNTNKNVKNERMEEPPESPGGGIGELLEVELRIPAKLNNEEFIGAWNEWVEHRRSLKKPKDWHRFFQRQLDWLDSLPYSRALATVSTSCRNGYQGLIEVRETQTTNGKKHVNPDLL